MTNRPRRRKDKLSAGTGDPETPSPQPWTDGRLQPRNPPTNNPRTNPHATPTTNKQVTRLVVPPAFGVDVSPIIWFAFLNFLREILISDQGILTILSSK